MISIASNFLGGGMPLADLVQEGNLGLIRAVEKFDYQRGHRFGTYASYWIRQAVTRHITNHGRIIRMPANPIQQINQINRTEQELLQKTGAIPTSEEIAAVLSLLCRQRLTDTTSGFRCANRTALRHLAEVYACDYPEVESLISLRKAGFRVAETPVRMAPRAGGVSSIGPFRAAYYVTKVLLAALVNAAAAPAHTRADIERRAAHACVPPNGRPQ